MHWGQAWRGRRSSCARTASSVGRRRQRWRESCSAGEAARRGFGVVPEPLLALAGQLPVRVEIEVHPVPPFELE